MNAPFLLFQLISTLSRPPVDSQYSYLSSTPGQSDQGPSAEPAANPRRISMDGSCFARASGAWGPWVESDQQRALAQDGYDDLSRWWLSASGACWVAGRPDTARLGLGLGAAYAYTSRDAGGSAPRLRASTYAVLLDVPIVLATSAPVTLLFTPRAGVAFGTVGFGGATRTRSALAWGGDLTLLLFDRRVGPFLGVLHAASEGANARPDTDLGGYMVGLTGVFR